MNNETTRPGCTIGVPVSASPLSGATAADEGPIIDVKEGWKTSEFYVALAAKVASLVIVLYALSGKPADGQPVAEFVERAIVGIGGLVVLGVSVWQYIKGRSAVKVEALKSVTAIEAAHTGTPPVVQILEGPKS